MKRTLLSFLISTAMVMVSVGCNDSSSEDTSISPTPPPSTTNTGQFIDSPVSNVTYKTETKSGETDESGKYSYKDGENVTFSIGAISFPTSLAKEVITPLDLVDSNITDNPSVVNIIRLLQTLDSDGSANNGISIADEAHEVAVNTIAFNQSIQDFEKDQNVLSFIASAGQDEQVTALVPVDEAILHFETTLKDNGIAYGSIIGTWLATGENEDELLMFTFLDNGTYVHAEIDIDPWNAGNPNEINGMEWGEFVLSDKNELYSPRNYFDQNGDTGLTDIILSESAEIGESGDVLKLKFDDNILTFNLTEYDNGTKGESEDIVTFRKLEDNGIVGTWLSPVEDEFFMIAFLDDNTFVLASVDEREQGQGMEWGSYELNDETNQISVRFDLGGNNNTNTDLNGDVGFTDFVDHPSNKIFLEVDGNKLTARIIEDDEESTANLYRQ